MTLFLLGMSGFLGLHLFSALRSRAPDRDLRQRMGEARYMSVYSVLSFGFLGLILLGYRSLPDSPPIWVGPEIARTLSVPINLLALTLVLSAYLPIGYLKRTLHHPMMIGTGLWAVSHLWVGGGLAKILLMGGFAFYSIVSVFAAFHRGERVATAPQWGGDALALAGGLAITSVMLYLGHGHIL